MSRRRKRPASKWTGVSALALLVAGLLLVRCVERAVSTSHTKAPPHHLERHPHDGEATPPAVTAPSPRAADPDVGGPHLPLGAPVDADPSDDLVLDEQQYVVSYNPKRLTANWVAWRLDRSYLGHARRRDDFRADRALPGDVYHVTTRDYAHSGFDRGHLCPSADREASPEMNAITFLMTNIVPQLHELNAGPWERLEAHERELAGRPGVALAIVAGPLFAAHPPTIGHGIAVPRATFKIIVVLRDGQRAAEVTPDTELIAALLPNEPGVADHEWTEYVTSVDEIEKQSGYDFLRLVPDAVEATLEAATSSPK